MSKELIERAQNIARQLTYNDDTLQAQAKHTLLECAVRIEQLERELATTLSLLNYASDKALGTRRECDALLADNERLRKAIGTWERAESPELQEAEAGLITAMNTTPAQSLARIRNQVREECASAFGDTVTGREAAKVVRATKEPE